MLENIRKMQQKIKAGRPLILNITNHVTMEFIANGLLSLGASPIMSQSQEEAEDLVKASNAVVINLGTLDETFITLAEKVCQLANQYQKPIVFDPVGAGASDYRRQASHQLFKQFNLAIIRGNASEILALTGCQTKSRGVDSLHHSDGNWNEAKQFSHQQQSALVISGKTDVIIDADQTMHCDRGSDLMPKVTGTGCLLTAVVAAFHAVEADRFLASTCATYFYALCGETAAQKAQGPGSFKMHFLDALHEDVL